MTKWYKIYINKEEWNWIMSPSVTIKKLNKSKIYTISLYDLSAEVDLLTKHWDYPNCCKKIY